MDSGQYQHNLKLLKQGPSCLLLDVESAKITPGRNAVFNKSFSEYRSPVMTLRKGKIRRNSCDEYKEYPRLCFHVIHFNRAYTVRKNLCQSPLCPLFKRVIALLFAICRLHMNLVRRTTTLLVTCCCQEVSWLILDLSLWSLDR